MPKYLFAQPTLPEALRDKCLQVRLDYDGKYLSFEAMIQEGAASTQRARIVSGPAGDGSHTLADVPYVTSAEARTLIGFVVSYSRARVMRINSR